MIINFKYQSALLKILILLLLNIAAAYSKPASAAPLHHSSATKDSIVIKRTLNNKNHDARLYAGITKESLCFATKGKPGKSYQLFLFNMDGKLVKESRILDKQTTQLSEMEKGNYLFEVFSDDLRIENGSIVIK